MDRLAAREKLEHMDTISSFSTVCRPSVAKRSGYRLRSVPDFIALLWTLSKRILFAVVVVGTDGTGVFHDRPDEGWVKLLDCLRVRGRECLMKVAGKLECLR